MWSLSPSLPLPAPLTGSTSSVLAAWPVISSSTSAGMWSLCPSLPLPAPLTGSSSSVLAAWPVISSSTSAGMWSLSPSLPLPAPLTGSSSSVLAVWPVISSSTSAGMLSLCPSLPLPRPSHRLVLQCPGGVACDQLQHVGRDVVPLPPPLSPAPLTGSSSSVLAVWPVISSSTSAGMWSLCPPLSPPPLSPARPPVSWRCGL